MTKEYKIRQCKECEHNWHLLEKCRWADERKGTYSLARFICDKCGATKIVEIER